MKRLFVPALSLSALFVLLSTCSDSENSIAPVYEDIVLLNGILIDGSGSPPLHKATIVIEDKQIKYVGTDSNYSIPDDAKVIDVKGYTILPGFINSHVHGAYDAATLKEWAQAGVTTVRDLGNFDDSPDRAFSKRDNLLKDDSNARLVAAGPLVTAIAGYGNYEVNSADDARQKVTGLINAGANIIKVAIEDNLQGRTWPMLSMDEIKSVVQAAHDREIPVSAHISRVKHLAMAIDANVDDVAHMIIDDLPDSLITKMIAKNIYWVPTLELWDGVSQLHSLNWNSLAVNNLRRFVQSGGKVALGTDYEGYVTHFDSGMPVTEIKLMQQAGMTLLQIIVAATKHCAHVCNLEDETGTIETGKIADLLILKDNPLENIDAFSDVYMVIHNGRIIRETR